ncbi:MAG: hypothetical protein AB2693_26295, partial [Candidatus Thiodiazotropha sp.]
MSREIIGRFIQDCDERTVIAFSDGSCLENPGPCGAESCIYLPGHTEPMKVEKFSETDSISIKVPTYDIKWETDNTKHTKS